MENLIPLNRRSKEEQRQTASNGGKKSGEVRRRKRAMKDAVKLIMEMPADTPKLQNLLNMLGVQERDQTNQMAMIAAMLGKAIKGDVAAAAFLRDTAGEKPTEKVQNSGTIKMTISGEIKEWAK